jgi:hypothetical protein
MDANVTKYIDALPTPPNKLVREVLESCWKERRLAYENTRLSTRIKNPRLAVRLRCLKEAIIHFDQLINEEEGKGGQGE